MDSLDRAQLDAVVNIVGRLGERIVGTYYYGSGVLDALRPNSDIDVFVLLGGATVHEERNRLVEGLMQVSGPEGTVIAGRPVDVTMARVDELRPWRPDPTREFQYGEWLRADYGAGFVPGPTTDPDLAAQIATLLAASQPLIGPRAEALLDPVPEPDLIDAMRRSVPALMNDLPSDSVNVLLTLARIGYTISHGAVVTKDAAADWAIEQLRDEDRQPLAHARRAYLVGMDSQPGGFVTAARATADQIVQRLVSG